MLIIRLTGIQDSNTIGANAKGTHGPTEFQTLITQWRYNSLNDGGWAYRSTYHVYTKLHTYEKITLEQKIFFLQNISPSLQHGLSNTYDKQNH